MNCGPKQMAGLGNEGWGGVQTSLVYQPTWHRGWARVTECGLAYKPLECKQHLQPKGRAGCPELGGIQTWAVHTTHVAQRADLGSRKENT